MSGDETTEPEQDDDELYCSHGEDCWACEEKCLSCMHDCSEHALGLSGKLGECEHEPCACEQFKEDPQ